MVPPNAGRSPTCQGGASGGNGNKRRPKNCDLGDGATIDLSTLVNLNPKKSYFKPVNKLIEFSKKNRHKFAGQLLHVV